ncbi:hypothetical protein HDU67_000912 [Dinochytrium kinnereticum]|nr:hypothetical protein HDU67_000912 [Dinochytrium kinnereticum]
MAPPLSDLTNPGSQIVTEEECYYSQIKDCQTVPGWLNTAIILAWVNWATVILGILTTGLSVYVRRRRAIVRGNSIPKFYQLSQFEIFLSLMAVACCLNASALTLSTYVSIKTVLMHSLSGGGAFVLYNAVLLFVNMVLKSSSLQNRTIRIIRTVFVPMLMVPITIVAACFIYQGVYSDYFQYENHTKDVKGRFSIIVFSVSGLWLICFIALDVVLIVARNSFSSHLKSVVGSTLSSGRSRSGAGSEERSISNGGRKSETRMFSGPASKTGNQSHSAPSIVANQQAEVVLALKNAVTTLGWLAVGVTILIIYSMFYGASIFLISSSVFLYYSTLLVSYCTAFLISLMIYIVNLINVMRHLFNVQELELSMNSQTGSVNWKIGKSGNRLVEMDIDSAAPETADSISISPDPDVGEDQPKALEPDAQSPETPACVDTNGTSSGKRRGKHTNLNLIPDSVTLSSRSTRRAAAMRSTYGSPSTSSPSAAPTPTTTTPAAAPATTSARKRAKKASSSPSKTPSTTNTVAMVANVSHNRDNSEDEEDAGPLEADVSSASLSAGGAATGRLTFPTPRIKAIMKEDTDVVQVAADAAVLMSLATEMFLEKLTRDSWQYTAHSDRKTIAYRDVATAVHQREELEFLEDVIPQTMPLRRALDEKKRLAADLAIGSTNEAA